MIRTLLQRIRREGLSTKLPVSVLLAGFLLVIPYVAHGQGIGSAIGNWFAETAGGIIGTIAVPIALLFLSISNFVLWVSGLIFNWAVIRTVFQFGTYFGTSGEMLVAWGVMRDVANIGLLFGFIFMGVLLILNVEGGGHGHGGGISAKKAIPRLLIFAVLVNFSLFTTQAVIDVSNGLASVFAEQAGQKCDLVGDAEKCANLGIASVISQRAGITTIFKGGPSPLDDPLKTAVVYVGLSIFVMITAMVLLAGAIMFIYRAVVLSFLMVTSPIGFAGMAIPSLKKIADEWWSKLISQAFFAPVYLLLIFISLKLTETLADVSVANGGKGSLASALAGTGGEPGSEAGNIQIVLVFMVVIGFMMASLVTANKMGATGAKFATKTAGALTIGTAGFVGRRTLGKASASIAERVRSNPRMANTLLGKGLIRSGDYGANASFSLRTLANKAAGSSLELGNANKTASHGIHGIEEKAVEDREKELKKQREVQSKDTTGHELNEEVKDIEKALEGALSEELAAVEEQKKKVASAREKGDAALLEQERRNLGWRVKAYDTQKKELLTNDPRFKDLGEKRETAKNWRKDDERRSVNQQVEELENNAHSSNVFVRTINNITLESTVAHHTAEKIIKEASKSALEKALKNAMKDMGDPAPPPNFNPPPTGGGGPGPTPAPH